MDRRDEERGNGRRGGKTCDVEGEGGGRMKREERWRSKKIGMEGEG